MFRVTISYEDFTGNEVRDFHMILPKPMYQALFTFVTEIEFERVKQEHRDIVTERKNDKKRTGI